MVSRPPFGSCA
jgi:hypothetical protein